VALLDDLELLIDRLDKVGDPIAGIICDSEGGWFMLHGPEGLDESRVYPDIRSLVVGEWMRLDAESLSKQEEP
jgi:hypothetical protein